MGSIFSAIGRLVDAIISAVTTIIMAILGAITTIFITIFDLIADILCCRCGERRRYILKTRREGAASAKTAKKE